MKLKYYIKSGFENSFGIPIYIDENENVCYHKLDKTSFRITEFDVTNCEIDNTFIEIENQRDINIGDIGIIIFIGKGDKVIIDNTKQSINEMFTYLENLPQGTNYVQSEIVALAEMLSIELTVVFKAELMSICEIFDIIPTDSQLTNAIEYDNDMLQNHSQKDVMYFSNDKNRTARVINNLANNVLKPS